MNKGKLRSLMFHAGFCNEDGGWDNRPLFEQEYDNFQRFAELIVRECIDQGKQVQSQTVSNGSEDYNEGRKMGIEVFMNQIKKHFGVEE